MWSEKGWLVNFWTSPEWRCPCSSRRRRSRRRQNCITRLWPIWPIYIRVKLLTFCNSEEELHKACACQPPPIEAHLSAREEGPLRVFSDFLKKISGRRLFAHLYQLRLISVQEKRNLPENGWYWCRVRSKVGLFINFKTSQFPIQDLLHSRLYAQESQIKGRIFLVHTHRHKNLYKLFVSFFRKAEKWKKMCVPHIPLWS